jgi:hypothetical protein
VPVLGSSRFQDQFERVDASSTLVIVPGVGHDKDLVACGQTDGLVNTEHIYRWFNAKLSLGAPCDSIFCGGGTVYGDTMYSGTDAFVFCLSPYMYCPKVRSIGGN